MPKTLRVLAESPIPLPRPWSISMSSHAMVPSESQHLATDAHRVVADLLHGKHFANGGELRDVSSIEKFIPAIGESLEQSGIVQVRRSESGAIVAMGINFSAVRYEPLLRVSRPSLEFNILEKSSCATMHSRLDLLCLLHRQGFAVSWDAPRYWDATTPDVFRAQSVLNGSKLYFVCLIYCSEMVSYYTVARLAFTRSCFL